MSADISKNAQAVRDFMGFISEHEKIYQFLKRGGISKFELIYEVCVCMEEMGLSITGQILKGSNYSMGKPTRPYGVDYFHHEEVMAMVDGILIDIVAMGDAKLCDVRVYKTMASAKRSLAPPDFDGKMYYKNETMEAVFSMKKSGFHDFLSDLKRAWIANIQTSEMRANTPLPKRSRSSSRRL